MNIDIPDALAERVKTTYSKMIAAQEADAKAGRTHAQMSQEFQKACIRYGEATSELGVFVASKVP